MKQILITTIISLSFIASLQANILITEVVDPVDDYTMRYVEICNIGDSVVDISNYYLNKYSNGSTTSTCSKSVPTGTVLMPDDCFIFYHSTPPINFSDCTNVINDIICISGNGDDVYELHDGNNPIDRYGVVGETGGEWDYQDARVYRNFDVTQATIAFNINEWTIEPAALASTTSPCASEVLGNNSCSLILSDPVFICLSNSPLSDELLIDIPYTGFDSNAVIEILVNNNPVLNVSDDPSTIANGVISFYAFEGDAYTIQFIDSDCNSLNLQGAISSSRCNNYYQNIESEISNGSRCETLKTALHNLIDDHTVIPYTATGTYDVPNFMCDYDVAADGTVLDRYTNDSQGNCSGGNLPNGMNRDHIVPSSWWGGSNSSPQYTDLFNLFPSDASANSAKNNYPLGNVGAANYTTSNGTQVGSDSPNCIAANVFEPTTIYKGDFARAFLYMATRYEDVISSWETQNNVGDQALTSNSFMPYEACLMNILLQWHQTDPVSQLEIDRNEAVFSIQGNRNPFVDHPEYVELIWEVGTCFIPLNVCLTDACDFTPVSVVTNSSSNNIWVCNNGSYQINPFCGVSCNEPSEQWLVSTLFSYPNSSVLSFTLTAVENYDGPDLEILYSTNYNGANTASAINAATWNPLSSLSDDTNSSINLINSLSASERAAFYLGIKHTATGGSANGNPPGTGEWTLENLSIQSDNCSSTCGASTQIIGLPSITSSNSPINLTASPAGGTFSGNGIIFNAFNPSISGAGNHTITYTYVDENGCTYLTSQDILVFTVTSNFVNYNLGTISP